MAYGLVEVLFLLPACNINGVVHDFVLLLYMRVYMHKLKICTFVSVDALSHLFCMDAALSILHTALHCAIIVYIHKVIIIHKEQDYENKLSGFTYMLYMV